jgi:hypothetical protein
VAATWIVEAVDVFKDGHLSLPAAFPSMSPDEFSLAFHGWVLRRNVPRVLDLKNVSTAALSTAQQGLRSKSREG